MPNPSFLLSLMLGLSVTGLTACGDKDSGSPDGDGGSDDGGWTDGGGTEPLTDADRDGHAAEDGDCDDSDPAVFPGAEESCNGIDDNCNGLADEGFGDSDDDGLVDCLDVEECDGLDNDGDGQTDEGFGDADEDGVADCADGEDCDGIDNDGDGDVDEGYDADGDGVTTCADSPDCDDSDATRSPLVDEVAGDLIDNDCDGLVDEGDWAVGDLVITEIMANPGAVSDPAGEWIELLNRSGRTLYLNGLTFRSANDADAKVDAADLLAVEADAYVLVGINADFDSNGGVDLAWAWSGLTLENEADSIAVLAGDVLLDQVAWDDGASMPDPDGASMSLDELYLGADLNDEADGWCASTERWGVGRDYGSPGADNPYCQSTDHDGDGYGISEGDCDDDDPSVGPGAVEIWYDGFDQDCDGLSDYDADADGFDSNEWSGDDCDDTRAEVNPGAVEVCDDEDLDEDCNGLADDLDPGVSDIGTWYPDDDGDGWGGDGAATVTCEPDGSWATDAGDCDDSDAAINPGAVDEWYDGVDSDCDGWNDYDADRDGFDSEDWLGTDCDDELRSVHPYAWEDDSDGLDNDCDGFIDLDDPDVPTSLRLSDDSSSIIRFDDVTFPFCGVERTSAYVISNGRITFGSSDTSYSEASTTFESGRVTSVAGWWDDLNPSSGGEVYWLEHDDAVSVWFIDVTEYGATNDNTFSYLLRDDGTIILEYGGMDSNDGIVGWSCGTGLNAASVDLTEELADLPAGSAGIGAGTEDAVYEWFTSSMDIEDTSVLFCGQAGTDADGDGWTDRCGDTDDDDAGVMP